MKRIVKVACVLLAAASLFVGGILYTVYNAEITWGQGAETTMNIYLHGMSWDFPAYNDCGHAVG